MIDLEQTALQIACPFCGKAAGQPCRSWPTHRNLPHPHPSRVALGLSGIPVQEAEPATTLEQARALLELTDRLLPALEADEARRRP